MTKDTSAKDTPDEKPAGFIDERAGQQAEALKKRPVAGQKHYFEVDPKTKKYLRKSANIVEIDNERAVLRIDGEDWAIPSAYDIVDDLVAGDWILGHAYPGIDGFKKFFPLGPDNEFLEARDARNAFLPTDITSTKDVPAVRAEEEHQNDLKAQLLRLAGEIAGVHATTTEFGQALGQIIQNARAIAKTATGQVTAANAIDNATRSKEKSTTGRAPVKVRPRDAAPVSTGNNDAKESKKDTKRRGRGLRRVRSHFQGQE